MLQTTVSWPCTGDICEKSSEALQEAPQLRESADGRASPEESRRKYGSRDLRVEIQDQTMGLTLNG